MAHDHGHRAHHEPDRRALELGFVLIVGFMAVEVAVGVVANSLALLSDAAHMLTDAAALGLSVLAARLAERPARGAMTYGLGRVEILSAQVNGLTLALLGVVIVAGAIDRLVSPGAINASAVLWVALAGIVVNLVVARVLRSGGDHSHSLNVEGAYRHIVTDLFGFLLTAVAAVVILATGFR